MNKKTLKWIGLGFVIFIVYSIITSSTTWIPTKTELLLFGMIMLHSINHEVEK